MKLHKRTKIAGWSKLKPLLSLFAAVASVFVADARNLVWMGAAGDSLANPAKWYIQSPWAAANDTPGPDDKIVIAIDHPLTLDVTNATDMDIVNGCAGICLPESTSKCYITVPDGCDKSITVPIVGAYDPLSGDL